MVKIKVLHKDHAAAGGRATPFASRALLVGWIAAALVLFAAFGSSGEDRDRGASESVASAPIPVEPLGVPPVSPSVALEGDGADEADGAPGPEAPAAAATSAPETERREGLFPDHVLQWPASADSVLVFDLRQNRMHLFERVAGQSRHTGDYFVAVGKQGIDKQREGDEKTPIGLYYISSYIPGDTLPAIYGVGAYPITYPNTWDRRLGRTGSGIWIHGTDKDDDSLLPKSSRGCLTLRNDDFEVMSKMAHIRRTPVIVTDQFGWRSSKELDAMRDSLATAVETWRTDWESRDTDRYLSHYSPSFRTDSMSLARWTAHKRRVNSAKKFIRIGLDDVGIYRYPGEAELYLVTFQQSYSSNNFNSRKWKQQFWRQEAGAWRIVHEG